MAQTRDRIVAAASGLFRTYGYTGTGLKRIAAESGAPFGSVYHFFPGGKEELGAAAIRAAAPWYAGLVLGVLAEVTGVTGPADALRRCFARAAEDLVAADFADACPVATVALEVSSTSEVLRTACADVFEQWIGALSAWLTGAGVPEDAARPLALQTIAVLEGAFVLARASRDTESLYAAGDLMADRLRAVSAG